MNEELTVVVADDEPELLNSVCQLVDWQSVGFRLVGRAGNGLDALQLVEELQPDLLLTDIQMPFISGTALARQVKAVQPLIQVAFLSGYDHFEYAKSGIEDEIVAYLLKPISTAELTEELKKLHARICRRLECLTMPRSGVELRQMLVATMLLDEHPGSRSAQNIERLRRAGLEIPERCSVMAAVIRTPGAEPQTVLSIAGQTIFQTIPCSGFCSGERTVLLLTSGNGFALLMPALDKLCQAIRRICGVEASIGISREFFQFSDCRAAYLEAMEALQTAERSGGIHSAGGWDDMALLCARAMKIIEKEYMDETLTLQSVSDRLHISPSYLGANIKKYGGDTFLNLLTQKRMRVAEELLQNGKKRISEIARRCGYVDQSYFGYCFKKYYGASPVRMRQLLAKNDEVSP